MFSTVKIGEQEIELLANAATAYRFREVFYNDLIEFFTSGAAEASQAEYIELAQQMGFIMQMQAQKADFSKINEESYVRWLEDFDQFDLVAAAQDIIHVYQNDQKSLSKAKKKDVEQSGE